jgi:hypothetical protein
MARLPSHGLTVIPTFVVRWRRASGDVADLTARSQAADRDAG